MRRNITALLALLLFATTYCAQAQDLKKATTHNNNFHAAYTPSFANDRAQTPVRNVILMIGDGMGLAHITAGMFLNHGALTITNLKSCGFVRTQAAGDDFTTDSAASGTAYATGKKTSNKSIGMDSTHKAIANIPEKLAPLGYVSGVITTDEIDGATPSAFYAHQPDRNMSKEILSHLPQSHLTFFAGGGQEIIDEKCPELWGKLADGGYSVSKDNFDRKLMTAPKVGVLPVRSIASAPKVAGRGEFLPDGTKFAIEFLNSKQAKGFFLMVEGAHIDSYSHQNKIDEVAGEVLDFDKAVEAAIRFAEKDGNTLVIISADHETGGLCLIDGSLDKSTLNVSFSRDNHTSVMVPLFAYGPHSDKFTGIQHNSDVSRKIIELLSQK